MTALTPLCWSLWELVVSGLISAIAKQRHHFMPSILERVGLANLTIPQLALLAANLTPVAGVLFWDWEVFVILFLFWLENLILGFFNVIRMLSSVNSKPLERIFLSAFFCFHYGMFTAGHGAIIFELFGDGRQLDLFDLGVFGGLENILSLVTKENLTLAALALLVSHGISLVMNYWLSGEYRKTQVNTLMAAPYGRIIALHFTVLVGGLLAQKLGSPIWALLVLLGIKIAIDLASHRKEHEKLQAEASDESNPEAKQDS